MHQPIQLKTKIPSRAWALQLTSAALIFAFAILLANAGLAAPILGNYPDTTLALSTDTTVTPDVPPTNTTSINVSTSTDFKGTFAGDSTTGVVRVTDAHPAGTYTVTVTAFDSGGETATKTFALTVTTPVTCKSVSFAAFTNFGVRPTPYSVAVGDFNGDGNQDLATANFASNTVSILLGNGRGRFSSPRDFGSGGSTPVSVAVGDFNGDGNQDLAVANFDPNGGVSILLGDGTGDFSAATNFGAGVNPHSVAVGDFNGDGNQDLAVADLGGGVSILLGDGAGDFSAATNFGAGSSPYSVTVGDFNGDGNQDLAVANSTSQGTVSILLGDGTGDFSAATNFGAGSFPHSVTVGDFNGDGNQDLAVTNENGGNPSNVSILMGNGDGTFSVATNFDVESGPRSIAVGDFNGDGKQDLAVANENSNHVSMLLGDGTGNFSAATNITVAANSTSVAVGDFNGDGNQDLAVAVQVRNVSILLRSCPVSQITPAETTCSQFSSGTAETLSAVQYDVDNDVIQRVNPRNFLYWVAVTAPAGDNIFRITQTITTGNFNTFFAAIGHGSKVFDSNCVSLERTGGQIGDTMKVRFNAPVAGTYYISINFNSQNLIGQPAPNPGTMVHYDFMTTGVPDSTIGLDLVRH